MLIVYTVFVNHHLNQFWLLLELKSCMQDHYSYTYYCKSPFNRPFHFKVHYYFY